MTKEDIVTAIGKMPVAILWRHIKSIVAAIALMWGTLWWFGADAIQAKADDALLSALGRQGMAPKDFIDMKATIGGMKGDVSELKEATKHLDDAAEDLNNQLGVIKSQLDGVAKETERTNQLLRALIPVMKTETQPVPQQ